MIVRVAVSVFTIVPVPVSVASIVWPVPPGTPGSAWTLDRETSNVSSASTLVSALTVTVNVWVSPAVPANVSVPVAEA